MGGEFARDLSPGMLTALGFFLNNTEDDYLSNKR